MDRAFRDGLSRILGVPSIGQSFDRDRWERLFYYGLRPMLGSLRDVHRFMSAFSFTVGMFFRGGVLEVNLIDLIGIEASRVFEPDVYERLPGMRDLLVGRRSSWGLGDERKRAVKEVEELLELADAERRQGARLILSELFPAVEWMLKSYSQGQGFEDGWLRELRICHTGLFGRYFTLAVPEGDVPQAVVNRLLGHVEDRAVLREALVGLHSHGHLPQALDWLEAHAAKLDIRNPVGFVTALFDVGDLLADESEASSGRGPTSPLTRPSTSS